MRKATGICYYVRKKLTMKQLLPYEFNDAFELLKSGKPFQGNKYVFIIILFVIV